MSGAIHANRETIETRINKDLNIEIIKKQLCNGIYTEKNDNNYFYGDSIPWGISKLLEDVLKTSPQNINQHINRGRIKDIRSVDSAILNTIEETERRLI